MMPVLKRTRISRYVACIDAFRKASAGDMGDARERAELIASILFGLYGDEALTLFAEANDEEDGPADRPGPKEKRFRLLTLRVGGWRMVKRWEPLDHPRGKDGRFIPKGSPEAVAAAKDAVGRVLRGEKGADGAESVAEHLGILSVKQLRELHKQHGKPVPGKLREQLVSAVLARLQAGEGDKGEGEGDWTKAEQALLDNPGPQALLDAAKAYKAAGKEPNDLYALMEQAYKGGDPQEHLDALGAADPAALWEGAETLKVQAKGAAGPPFGAGINKELERAELEARAKEVSTWLKDNRPFDAKAPFWERKESLEAMLAEGKEVPPDLLRTYQITPPQPDGEGKEVAGPEPTPTSSAPKEPSHEQEGGREEGPPVQPEAGPDAAGETAGGDGGVASEAAPGAQAAEGVTEAAAATTEKPERPAYERTTPAKGAPEREALDKARDEHNARMDAHREQVGALRDQVAAAKSGTKKREQLKAKLSKLEDQGYAMDREAEGRKKQTRAAYLEDVVEEGDEANRLAALAELKHPDGKDAYSRIKDMASAKLEGKGLDAETADGVAASAANMLVSYPGIRPLDEQLDIEAGTAQRQAEQRLARESLDALPELGQDAARFRRRLEHATPEEAAAIVNEAKELHASRAKSKQDAEEMERQEVASGTHPRQFHHGAEHGRGAARRADLLVRDMADMPGRVRDSVLGAAAGGMYTDGRAAYPMNDKLKAAFGKYLEANPDVATSVDTAKGRVYTDQVSQFMRGTKPDAEPARVAGSRTVNGVKQYLLEGEKGKRSVVDADLYETTLRNNPGAALHLNNGKAEGDKMPLAIVKDGEKIGVFMPLQRDEFAELALAGEAPAEVGQDVPEKPKRQRKPKEAAAADATASPPSEAAEPSAAPGAETVLPNSTAEPKASSSAKPPHEHVLDAIDKHGQGHNLANMVDIRRHLAEQGIATREAQDAAIEAARRGGHAVASGAEGRFGFSAEEREASLPDEQSMSGAGHLLYLSRRKTPEQERAEFERRKAEVLAQEKARQAAAAPPPLGHRPAPPQSALPTAAKNPAKPLDDHIASGNNDGSGAASGSAPNKGSGAMQPIRQITDAHIAGLERKLSVTAASSPHRAEAEAELADARRHHAAKREVEAAAKDKGYRRNDYAGKDAATGEEVKPGAGFVRKNPTTGKWETHSFARVQAEVGHPGVPVEGTSTPAPSAERRTEEPGSVPASAGSGAMSETLDEPKKTRLVKTGYAILEGNTYAHRDALKRAGAKWDAENKVWKIPIERGYRVPREVDRLDGVRSRLEFREEPAEDAGGAVQ